MTLHVWNPSDYPTFCSCTRPMGAEDLMCDECSLEQAELWAFNSTIIKIWFAMILVGMLVAVGFCIDAGYHFSKTFH